MSTSANLAARDSGDRRSGIVGAPWRRIAAGPLGGGGLLLASCTSIQIGAALATTTFATMTPAGAAGWRFSIAAVVLLVATRPKIRTWSAERWRIVALFGLAIAANEVCLYLALNHLPLGMAVTLEFLGPLGLALTHARSGRHVWCALLALVGVVLLCATTLVADPSGIALALAAAVGWAMYILASSWTGEFDQPGQSLAVAVSVAALATLPLTVFVGASRLTPGALAVLVAVAVFGTIAPYALELAALRRLAAGTAGILFSIEPAIGALVGFIALSQGLSAQHDAGIVAVVIAGVIALRDAPV